jgi:hypothetical protein
MSETLVKPEKPVCSKCGERVAAVVAFMSRTVRDGKICTNRGASRGVRLCKPCVNDLRAAFGGGS